MFVAVVDPSMVNVIEDPPSYFISIRQLSLPVDFRHFLLTNQLELNLKIRHGMKIRNIVTNQQQKFNCDRLQNKKKF